jgi:gluconokinase
MIGPDAPNCGTGALDVLFPSVPVVVMGVSGSGKTTVGTVLAERLGVEFADADDLHPAANVAKMSRGEPLTDDDRRPWLDLVAAWLSAHPDAVMSCSALRRRYRDRLRRAGGVLFVHLDGPESVVADRVGHRAGHYMPASLLRSQYDTLEPLEPDEPGLVLPLDQPVDRLVEEAVAWLSRPAGG